MVRQTDKYADPNFLVKEFEVRINSLQVAINSHLVSLDRAISPIIGPVDFGVGPTAVVMGTARQGTAGTRLHAEVPVVCHQ